MNGDSLEIKNALVFIGFGRDSSNPKLVYK